MSGAKHNPLVRVLPSLTDLAFLMPIVFLFCRLNGAKTMLGDGDTGWHVRTGEWILANGRIPDKDIFSFTRPQQPWFAWEWLWDVSFAWLHQHGGMAAVVLVNIFLLSATFTILFRLIRWKCGNVLIASAMTSLAVAVSSLHWLARPHLVTLLFVVIFYSILEHAERGHTRLLVWLPLLTIPWTNLHGGFFVGIALTVLYAVAFLAGALLEPDAVSRAASLARSKPYWLAALGCLAASLVNPYTYHLHQHIYKYLTDPYLFDHILEFQSFSFRHPVALFLEPLLLVSLAAAFWNLYKKRFSSVILIAGWAHLALLSRRNVPIFAIIAAPVVALALQEWLTLAPAGGVAAWLRKTAAMAQSFAGEVDETDRIGRLHLTSAMAALVLIALFYAPNAPAKCRAEYDPKLYPAKALAVLRKPELAKSIFTGDQWGDYLIYRLYPNTKVFVDGRSDFYGTKFSETYLDVMSVKYDWQESLDRYGVDTVLLSPNAPLAGTLKESSRWRPIYDDGTAIVFSAVRSSAAAGQQVSIVHRNNGKDRDRKVTKFQSGDHTITKTKFRSEPT